MARYVFKLPDVGEGTTEASIVQWHVSVGGFIREDEPLVSLETDKAIVEVPAPTSGKVLSLNGAVGERVAVGAELAVLETDEAEAQDAAPAVSPPESIVRDDAAVDAPARPERVLASPAVRKRARELGIDLAGVTGSGPGGRITREDLEVPARAKATVTAEPPPASRVPQDDVAEEIRIVGVRRRIAERMQESKRRIPHFSYIEEVDVTALEALREHLNEQHAGERQRLSPLPFMIRAIVRAVQSHPEMNARFDDDRGVITRYRAVHVGIATQTPNGLMVPVLANAQDLTLWECASQIARLASLAREGRATRAELTGSTITVTSLGALGGIASTPVINHPEVAIVGLNRIRETATVRNGALVLRKTMNVSSSFDHRVVDGWNAASFIQRVRSFLEQPATLFMD